MKMRRQYIGVENPQLRMDTLAAFMLFFATVIGAYVYTQSIDIDPVLASKAAFMPVLAWSGVMARALFTGWQTASPVGGSDVVKVMLGGSIAFAAIVAIMSVPNALSATAVGNTIFYANMGIIEEVFFNYALFGIVALATAWRAPGAFLAVAAVFPLFHIGVYGWDPTFFALAFMARMVLCAAYYFTGHLSSAILAHVLFNIVAAPGSILAFGGAP